MHFLCGWAEIEKLQSEDLKVSKARWRVREDNAGGWRSLRKYNIMTVTSCNCRNRPETSDDVYSLRGAKITSDHRGTAVRQ